jgi:hypothetical protein
LLLVRLGHVRAERLAAAGRPRRDQAAREEAYFFFGRATGHGPETPEASGTPKPAVPPNSLSTPGAEQREDAKPVAACEAPAEDVPAMPMPTAPRITGPPGKPAERGAKAAGKPRTANRERAGRLAEAVRLVRGGGARVKEAARLRGLPESTLRQRLKTN